MQKGREKYEVRGVVTDTPKTKKRGGQDFRLSAPDLSPFVGRIIYNAMNRLSRDWGLPVPFPTGGLA